MDRPIGDLSDWESWTDSGCERLALEVAKQKGRQYAMIYAAYRRAKSEDKKKYYQTYLKSIEYFFTRSFIGALVDSDTVLASIRYGVDKEMGIKFRGWADHD